MKRLISAFVLGGLLAAAGPATAHHGLAKQFDMGDEAKIARKGKIVKVFWQNPHIYFQLEVEEGGETNLYNSESVPVAMARNAGLTSKRLRGDGQPVEVTFRPSLKDPFMGFSTYLEYDDGFVVTFEGFRE